jgi:hypothetical protein
LMIFSKMTKALCSSSSSSCCMQPFKSEISD